MSQSLADRIAGLPDPKVVTDTGSAIAHEIAPELPDSDMISVPPHLISRVDSENAIVVPIPTADSGEISEAVVTEEQLLANLKQELLNKGVSPGLVENMTIKDFEIVGKTRKNKMVTSWEHKRKADKLIKEQAHVSPVEQPKTVSKKVKNPMTKYDETIKQHDQDIKDLTAGMKKIISLLSANQTSAIPAMQVSAIESEVSVIPKVSKQTTQPIMIDGETAIPKVAKQKTAITTSNGQLVAAEVFYPFVLKQLKARNKPYGKENKVSKGVHAVFGGLNKAVKDYYGEDTDVIALTNAMEKRGIIRTKMVRGGPMVFLPEDFQASETTGSGIVFPTA